MNTAKMTKTVSGGVLDPTTQSCLNLADMLMYDIVQHLRYNMFRISLSRENSSGISSLH